MGRDVVDLASDADALLLDATSRHLLARALGLFGALLSGLLVTELVYYYVTMSFVLPVIIAVLFTMLHALIQAYVLTTLTSMFYGEATEKHEAKPKAKKVKKIKTANN